MADGAGTSASRRRQRRLRSWLRHERQTVAMELAAALHHSRDARSNVVHEALRGQKTASSGSPREPLEVSEPQVGAVTVGYATTIKYLLKCALRKGQKEEEEEERRRKEKKEHEELMKRAQNIIDDDPPLLVFC